MHLSDHIGQIMSAKLFLDHPRWSRSCHLKPNVSLVDLLWHEILAVMIEYCALVFVEEVQNAISRSPLKTEVLGYLASGPPRPLTTGLYSRLFWKRIFEILLAEAA